LRDGNSSQLANSAGAPKTPVPRERRGDSRHREAARKTTVGRVCSSARSRDAEYLSVCRGTAGAVDEGCRRRELVVAYEDITPPHSDPMTRHDVAVLAAYLNSRSLVFSALTRGKLLAPATARGSRSPITDASHPLETGVGTGYPRRRSSTHVHLVPPA